jgi:hypothetical protein
MCVTNLAVFGEGLRSCKDEFVVERVLTYHGIVFWNELAHGMYA